MYVTLTRTGHKITPCYRAIDQFSPPPPHTVKKSCRSTPPSKKALDTARSLGLDSGPCWGHSSAGRALEWHSRGRRFDPAWLHQSLSCEIDIFKGRPPQRPFLLEIRQYFQRLRRSVCFQPLLREVGQRITLAKYRQVFSLPITFRGLLPVRPQGLPRPSSS